MSSPHRSSPNMSSPHFSDSIAQHFAQVADGIEAKVYRYVTENRVGPSQHIRHIMHKPSNSRQAFQCSNIFTGLSSICVQTASIPVVFFKDIVYRNRILVTIVYDARGPHTHRHVLDSRQKQPPNSEGRGV
jgi:hypothetical protein